MAAEAALEDPRWVTGNCGSPLLSPCLIAIVVATNDRTGVVNHFAGAHPRDLEKAPEHPDAGLLLVTIRSRQ